MHLNLDLRFSQNKGIVVFIVSIFFFFSGCDLNSEPDWISKLETDQVYVILRATDSKEGAMARSFNIIDKRPTHSGILICRDSKWLVYHVAPNQNNQSAFTTSALSEFVNHEGVTVEYFAILKENFGVSYSMDSLKKHLDSIEKQSISFDYEFCLSNSASKLYCSEFVIQFLNTITSGYFNPKPITTPIGGLISAFLNREQLVYYPVDYFLNSSCFELIDTRN